MGVSVRQKPPSDAWWVFIHYRGQRRSMMFWDKRTAMAVARDARRALAVGRLNLLPNDEPEGLTYETYSKQYLAKAKNELKRSTWLDYEGCSRRHLIPAFGKMQLTDIRRRDIKDFANKLRQSGMKEMNVKKHLRILSSVLSEAVEDELIPSNPALELRKLRRSKARASQKKRIVPLTAAEVVVLLYTAVTHTIVRAGKMVYPFKEGYTFLLLLARTGMRLGEAIALKWGDIDWRSGTILVERSFVRGELSSPKSGKSRRVDMSAQLQAALRERFEHRVQRVVAIDPERQAAIDAEAANAVLDSWVFPGVDGKSPMDEHLFRRRVFKPLLVAAKLRHIRIHDMRHGYASLLLGKGVDLQYVSQQLGHHSPSFTLSCYAHLLPTDRHGLVNALDEPAPNSTLSAPSEQNGVENGAADGPQVAEVVGEK